MNKVSIADLDLCCAAIFEIISSRIVMFRFQFEGSFSMFMWLT